MTDLETEVIIVGGGPVGLSLATDLSYRGVKTILLERSKTTSVIAKAFALNSRSMEHFRRMGVEQTIQDASLPRDLPFNFGMYTTILNGKTSVVQHYGSWGDVADGKPGVFYPFYEKDASPAVPMFCPQSSSEPALKEHLEATSQYATVLFGHRVTDITQDENEVIVTAVTEENEQEPKQKVFKARYLVACDGGGSPSRKLLGTHTYGKFVLARACSIMIHSQELFEQMRVEVKAGMSVTVNDYLTALVITANDKGDIVLHVLLPSTASDEEVDKFVQDPEGTVKKAMGSDLPFTVSAVSAYNMHALMSTKFRVNRCLFAGDSAHQWLPAGGLGLNTGVSDVGDIAWKLEAELKGFGGCNLLDSYEEERRPLDDTTRRFAMFLGRNILSDSPIFVFVRKIAMSFKLPRYILGKVLGGVVVPSLFESNLLTLGFQYSNSSIIMHEYDENGKVVPPSSYAGLRFPALPGCRAPHIVLPESESILDLFGKCFVMLIIGGEETDLRALKEELQRRNIPFQAYTYPRLPELVASYDRKYFLVRPDGIICWRSDTQPSAFESQKIAATVVGDTKQKRLPMPIERRESAPPYHTSAFLTDLLVRFSFETALINYFQLAYLPAWAISFGFFWIKRARRTNPPVQNIQGTSRHRAVVINEFGDADTVLKVVDCHTGSFGPHDVLIRVHAASVNPIDCRLRFGYGSSMLSRMLSQTRLSLFPLILGRDCSGEVVGVGDEVTKFLPGDRVFAAISPYKQGSYAQLVAANENDVSFMPTNIDFKEASSLPWVACTTWSALVKNAGLNQYNTRGKKVLVHAGTGGVGSFAVQLLKAWGADVTVTCSAQNVTLAHTLGADKVVDYNAGDFSTSLCGYDVVLDPIGRGYEKKSLSVLKLFGEAKYVSLISPQIWFTSALGPFVGGLVFSWMYRFKIAFNRLFFGRAFYYSRATPDGQCLDAVRKMVEKGEIKPLVEAVYSMEEIVAAHKHVETGHSRGKVVVSIP